VDYRFRYLASPVRLLLTGWLILALFSTACRQSGKNAITLAGSTSVEPFAERLAELYLIKLTAAHQKNGLEINVQGGGSSAGIQAVSNGICDIGMSSRQLTAAEKGLNEIPIAVDGIVIIVNRANRVQGLTIEQARDVFAGRVKNWHELGGRSRPITVISREDGSGTRASFEEKVMTGAAKQPEPVAADALVQDSNGAVREIVADDPDAVGYISFGLVDERVHPLSLDSVAPSEPSIRLGTYPVTRQFLFLTRHEPTGRTREFIDYVLSPEGQQVLVQEGLVQVGQ
jgi:phosphate transport system substrate-binding protein